MAGIPVTETFDGGLVTARHPALLQPGELQRSVDCVYRKFATSINTAPSRAAYNTAALNAASPIKGLAWLSFDQNSDQLLVYSGTALYASAFTGLTDAAGVNTFNIIPGISTLADDSTTTVPFNESMEVIQYGNVYYAMNGVDQPQRLAIRNSININVTLCTITSTTLVATTAPPGSDFGLVVAGNTVSGTGIAVGTRVLSVTDNQHLVLDRAASNGSGLTLTFSASTQAFLHGRRSGLTPIVWDERTAPGHLTIGVGTWNPNPADWGPGYYWFIYTEMVLDGKADDLNSEFIESGFIGKPISIFVPNITSNIVVRKNVSQTNANATHWQLYIGPRQDTADTVPPLNLFQRIGDQASLNSDSITLDNTSLSVTLFGTTATDVGGTWINYTNRNNVLDEDVDFASPQQGQQGNAMYVNFTIPNGTGAVPIGFAVEVAGEGLARGAIQPGASQLVVQLQRVVSGTVTKGSQYSFYSPPPGNFGYILHGGQLDTWGPTSAWTAADLVYTSDATCFRVWLFENFLHTAIRYVKLTVYLGGVLLNKNGAFFRTITYRSQVGAVVIDSAALPVPSPPSTGDVFQGKMVYNDTKNESRIVYSLPGFPEYFPVPYQLIFNSRLKDRVRVIRSLGQVLVVGMQSSIKRVNYLPDESDTSFQEGLAHEDLATDHGMIGTQGVCQFDLPGAGCLLAYLSTKGLHTTDGITTRFLCIDLDWENTVNVNFLSTAVLRNDRTNNWLVLYYCPAGASHGLNTRCLRFCYAPHWLKQSEHGTMLSAIGPSQVSGRSVAEVNLNGIHYLFTGHQTNGFVYVEDQGDTLPAGYTDGNATATIHQSILSRRSYAAGQSRDTREDRIYMMHDAIGDLISITGCTVDAVDKTKVTKASAFGSVLPGMIVTGIGIPPGTIVATKTSSSQINLSVAASTAGSVDLVFDDGTVSVTVRGQGIGENGPTTFDTSYASTRIGDVLVVHNDNTDQALELLIEKPADLGNVMKLHNFTMLLAQMGQEQNRA